MLGGLEETLDAAETPGDVVDGMTASASSYTGTDPMSLLAIEACLAAGRDEQLRERITEVLTASRKRVGQRLRALGVVDADETAAVLLAAVDGLLLHRVLDPDPADSAAVLRRLVIPYETSNESPEEN